MPENRRWEAVLKTEDRSWFEPLARELADDALGFAVTLTRDRATAEETLQEAFTRIWASPKTPSERGAFKRWLYRAILNLARDEARRQRRWSLLRLSTPPPTDPFDKLARDADQAVLDEALLKLNQRERAAVHLRYFEDQSFAQTADILGITEANARIIVHRALAKLRRTLDGLVTVGGVEA